MEKAGGSLWFERAHPAFVHYPGFVGVGLAVVLLAGEMAGSPRSCPAPGLLPLA